MYHPADFPPHLVPVGLLGEGAFGRVHAARTPDGSPVAVKVLASSDPDAAWRFDAEYRHLERLADPGFPRAVERGQTPGGRPYYAMELIAGTSPVGPMAAEAVEAHLLGVARALAVAHAQGWVHGDLKPENVVVTPEGRHVLLDVGLMAPVGARREGISGSLAYLAPEVLKKAPVSPAADMYALGCLAYEWLTGWPPFTGTPAEVIRGHLGMPPPALRATSPARGEGAIEASSPISGEVPARAEGAPLHALLTSLLSKDPTHRPTAAQLLGHPAAPTLAGGAFIGRTEILAAWPIPYLEITAPAGLGKTRTLDELRLAAPHPWIGVTCTPGDAPAGAARALVQRALDQAELTPEPTVAAWLAGTLPQELQDLEPTARKALVYGAAARALGQAATQAGGLAIGLDDWQLADGASRDFLAQARRELADAPICWAIATTDPTGQPLPPFTEAEARALLASRLGAPAPEPLAQALLPLAAGSPAALDALLEHAVARGLLRPRDGQWQLEPGWVLPADLDALWRERWAVLSPEARRLAAAAATAAPAGELPLAWLVEAAACAPEEVERLQAGGWLVGARLASPALAELARSGAAPETRAHWSTAWARRLEPRHEAARAALALQGDDDALAGELATRAAHAAMALGAPREAQALADAAISRHPSPALYLLRAEAHRFLDRLPEAAADYQEALTTHAPLPDQPWPEPAPLLPLLIGLAKTRQLQGDYPAARTLLNEALETATGAQRARILSNLARLDLFAGEMAGAEATAAEAAQVARAAGNQAILAQCLTLHGLLRFQRDLAHADEARGILEEALAIGERTGDIVGQGMAHDALGNLAMALGDLPRAAQAFQRFGEVCRRAGLATEGLMADLNAAIVAGEAADAPRALALATDVATRARAAGRRFVLGAALAVEGQARFLKGEDPAGPLDEALALAEALNNAVLETLVRMIRLAVAGETPAAHDEAAKLEALIARTGQEEAAGRLDGRLALLRRDPELARRRTGSRDQVAAHLAWRALAQLEGSPEAARHALAIATAWNAPAHIAADRRLLGPTHDGAVDPQRAGQWLEDLAAETDDLAALLLTAVLDLTGCKRGYILAYEAGRLSAAVTLGVDYAREVEQGFSRSIAERALFTATPLYVVDAGSDEAWRTQASVLALGLRTVLALPLAAGDQLLGVLYADREDLEPRLTDADVALLAGLAAAAAGLLARERALRDLATERDALALRLSLARALRRQPGRETFLAAAREAVGADEARWLQRPWGEGVSHSIADHVAETGEPLCLLDASQADGWQPGESVLALGLKTVWCLPVAADAVLYLTAERALDADAGRGLALLAALLAEFTAG